MDRHVTYSDPSKSHPSSLLRALKREDHRRFHTTCSLLKPTHQSLSINGGDRSSRIGIIVKISRENMAFSTLYVISKELINYFNYGVL